MGGHKPSHFSLICFLFRSTTSTLLLWITDIHFLVIRRHCCVRGIRRLLSCSLNTAQIFSTTFRAASNFTIIECTKRTTCFITRGKHLSAYTTWNGTCRHIQSPQLSKSGILKVQCDNFLTININSESGILIRNTEKNIRIKSHILFSCFRYAVSFQSHLSTCLCKMQREIMSRLFIYIRRIEFSKSTYIFKCTCYSTVSIHLYICSN